MRLLLLFVSVASAFVVPYTNRSPARLFSSPVGTEEIPITVTGNNIEVTPALEEYVNKKLERPLGKLRANGVIQDCAVHLSVNKNPKVKNAHRVDVTTHIVGTTIHSSVETPDMYASIDEVSDRLTRKLRRYKERRLAGWHGGKHMGEDMVQALDGAMQDLDEEEETNAEEDPFSPHVTRIRSFDLNRPISLDEAIFALDYVDHDFYVFRDEETDKISVVYKRNAGGVGLIQPDQ